MRWGNSRPGAIEYLLTKRKIHDTSEMDPIIPDKASRRGNGSAPARRGGTGVIIFVLIGWVL